MKKVMIIFFILILASLASADIDISKEAITEVVIKELNNPAIFNFTIENIGDSDNFEIYSLTGADFSPRGTFPIAHGETKKLEVKVYLDESIRKNTGYYKFQYKIRGQLLGIIDDELMVKIIPLKDIIHVNPQSIKINDQTAIITLKNLEKNDFQNMNIKFSAAFFEEIKEISLKPLEIKNITLNINKDISKLLAGEYTLKSEFEITDKIAIVESTILYSEEPGIFTNSEDSGFIVRENTVEKINKGNLPIVSQIIIKKNIISRLFSTFSSAPDSVERRGVMVYYLWQEEIRPGENFKVTIKTNWLYPILVIIAIVIIVFLLKLYLTTDINLIKKVAFVKTKGGEFALKVSILARARRYTENIKIIDKVPAIVKIHEKFNTTPDKLDNKNNRLEWNIPSLQAGELRVFSYIIYSKIGVTGEFALPRALALYEKDGKMKEISSNKAFFVSEQKN